MLLVYLALPSPPALSAQTFGLALTSHRQMVWSSDALSRCPFSELFHERPYLDGGGGWGQWTISWSPSQSMTYSLFNAPPTLSLPIATVPRPLFQCPAHSAPRTPPWCALSASVVVCIRWRLVVRDAWSSRRPAHLWKGSLWQ